MKRILMVLDAEFPPDERVEKEIESLKQAGYEVNIAVYTFTDRPLFESFNNYIIYRKKISKLLYKSSAASLVLPFYFKFWYRFLSKILKDAQYDFIHIHDLPLSKTGHKLALEHNMKLICDQHEYYSNWIIRTKHYNTFTGRIIRRLSHWERYERKYLNKADMVVTVAESLRELYIKRTGILPDKIVTLPNTPSVAIFNPASVNEKIALAFKDRFVLFYAGGLDYLRGIDFILEGLSVLKNEINNILFLAAGKENKSFSIKTLITRYGVEENVSFIGWVPLKELPSYVAASHICFFVPKADNLEINNTIVTKIYQYASMGKPIVVSEARLMKEFVERNQIGYSVPFGDVMELCSVVRKIYSHPEISENIRQKGIIVAKQNSWELTSLPFIEKYKQLN
jgi:glycosyltransferase involved in cell wall biosynthesis